MKALLTKLTKLEKYSRRLPLTPENQDEFLSFCSLKLLEGRNIFVKDYMFYVDFMRWHLGRNTYHQSRHERTSAYQTFEFNQVASHNEDEIVNRLSASQQVKRIMRNLCHEDQLILNFYYFDELSLKEISEILGVSQSAVSQKHKSILRKIKLCVNLDTLEFDL